MKTAKKAGLKSKSSTSKQKYILPTPPMTRRENGRANGASIDEELAGTWRLTLIYQPEQIDKEFCICVCGKVGFTLNERDFCFLFAFSFKGSTLLK